MSDAAVPPTIVIDSGSSVFKAGFAGDEIPKSVIPSLIGRPRYRPVIPTLTYRDFYVGDEAQRIRGILALRYPIWHGMIMERNDMEKVFEYVFKHELQVDPSQHPLLLTESAMNPRGNRELMTEMMFESFSASSLYIANQPVLSLYASGLVTGTVLYSGGGVTSSVPVYEGYALPHAILRANLGGRDLTEHLMRIFAEKGVYFTTTAEREIVRDIKEKLCYVTEDYYEELSSIDDNPTLQKSYTLPDGQIITVADERFRCPEVLFHPHFIGREADGIHQMIHGSVLKSDMHIHKDLFSNIVLGGGSTMFPGIVTRIKTELVDMVPPNTRIRILAPPERKYTVWIGGSILASLVSFREMYITKQDYEEHGSRIIHRKCFGFLEPCLGQGDFRVCSR